MRMQRKEDKRKEQYLDPVEGEDRDSGAADPASAMAAGGQRRRTEGRSMPGLVQGDASHVSASWGGAQLGSARVKPHRAAPITMKNCGTAGSLGFNLLFQFKARS